MNGAKVMVVDDSPLMVATLREMLEKLGLEVVGDAGDAEQAVFNFKSLKPDLVLMDLILPGETGLTALKKIRQLRPETVVLMVTAVGQDRVAQQAVSMGACGLLRKPFSMSELKTAVEKALAMVPASGAAPAPSGVLPEEDRTLMESLIQKGVQNAVQALAKMYGTQWALATSSFRSGPPSQFAGLFAGDVKRYSGVFVTFQQGMPFTCLVVFSEDRIKPLVDALAGRLANRLGTPEELEETVLAEVGNILSNSFLGTMGDHMPSPILLSVPHYAVGEKAALLKEALAGVKSPDDYILMCHVSMSAASMETDCDFLCLFSTEFIHRLLKGFRE